jgi:photosystem II stability/assembly factor-like uncharacterized protein
MKEKQRERVIHVKTVLGKADSSSWRVDETRAAGQQGLRSVFFLDDMHGWVGGRGALYRTTDGGKTWPRVDITVSKTACVKKLHFTNPTVGWAVVQEEASDPLTFHDNHFLLIRTSDGGGTWTTQLDSQDSVVNQIRFANEREAWLIGIKYTGLKPLRGEDFIFHTLDGGEHWADVSGSLNKMLTDLPIELGFTDILPEGPLTATVLMSEGNIFRTSDGGRTWQPQNETIDDFNYVCFCRIGMTDNHRVWVGGWKDDRRSVLGMVALKEGDSWKEYLLAGVSFSDIVFLSRDRILTCGSTTPSQQGSTEKREAVLSYSPDGGTSWSFVYRNPKASKINAIAMVDPNHGWAVGNDGLILRLTATTKTD